MSEECLKTINLTKQYPGIFALDRVNYTVYTGTVNALVGENGAGKSTLMKIISGNIPQSEGKILFNGEEVNFSNVNDAQAKGIGIIHQELNLFDNLTVAENVFVGKEIRSGKINLDRKTQNEKTAALLERLNYPLDPSQKVGTLKVGEKQIVEIIKAIAQDNLKILIMDEPTSSLSNSEVEILFRVINDLKKAGLTIIYISHRLDEILKISDFISILRDGKLVAEASTREDWVNLSWIIEKMIGHSKKYDYHIPDKRIGETILEIKDLTLFDTKRGYQLNNIHIQLREREILGIYGLLGSGRTELLESVMGMYPKIEGQILFKNRQVRGGNISGRIQSGIYLVPEDRQKQSLIQKSSIANNLVLSHLCGLCNGLTVSEAKKREAVEKIIADLYIKTNNSANRVTSLSGGNQQKVILGRGLLTEPSILLLDEPTKGVDIGAKHELFEIISNLVYKNNLSIILVSSEIEEILSISDRIFVLSNGFVAGEFTGSEMTEENLMRASSKYLGVENAA